MSALAHYDAKAAPPISDDCVRFETARGSATIREC